MPQASVLDASDIRRVFRAIEAMRFSDRNRLVFVLSLYGGLRVSEIAALKVGDVVTDTRAVRREVKLLASQTKGNRGRTIFLSNKLQFEIASYLPFCQCNPNDPLIVTRSGRAFSSVTLCMLFKSIYEAAGIRTSSHSGRRTFATRLNEQGVGMKTIQRLLGHKHISTTAVYCEVSESQLRNAVELV